MTDCNLETCSNTITGRQTYCSDRCRQRGRKGSRALRYRSGQNPQISPFQPVEPIEEFQPTSSSRKWSRPVLDLVGTDLLPDVIATETTKPKAVRVGSTSRSPRRWM